MGLISHLYGDHNKEELIRTIDSLISVVLQLATLAVNITGLYWLMHHTH